MHRVAQADRDECLEVDDTYVWRLEPLGLSCDERRDLLPAIPRPAELRPAQDRRELGALPAPALLHDWLRSPHLPRLPAVPRPHGAGAHSADASWLESHVIFATIFYRIFSV